MSDTTNSPNGPTRNDRAPVSSRAFSGAKGRSNRFLLVFVVVAVFVLLIVFFLHGSAPVTASQLGTVPLIPSAQGTKPLSPAYKAALAQADQDRADKARQNHTSALPTIQDDGLFTTPKPIINTAPVVAPITPYTPPQPLQTPGYQQIQASTGNAGNGNAQGNEQNNQATVQFMSTLGQKIVPANVIRFTQDEKTNGTNDVNDESGNASNNGANNGAGNINTETPAATTVANNVPAGPYTQPAAGTILYSQLLGRIDSDDPGPVIAEVLQGPLSGARLIGAFSAGKDGVIIKFSTMTVPYTDENGQTQTQTITISAVAVDQTHLGDAMATYVNNHILARVGLGFATAFLQGFGQAIASSGSTTVETGTGAIATTNPTLNTKEQLEIAGGQAAGNTGQIFNQIYGNMPPTIVVDANTPFGLLFLGQQGS